MKHRDLITQLQTDPSASDVLIVQEWLAKRQKYSKAVDEVMFALVESKPNAETYLWIERWLETRGGTRSLPLLVSKMPDGTNGLFNMLLFIH